MLVEVSLELEEFLAGLLEEVPESATSIYIELPSNLTGPETLTLRPSTMLLRGRQAKVYRSAGFNEDVLHLEWTEEVDGRLLHFDGVKRYIPSQQVKSGREAYAAVRRSGGTVDVAKAAASNQQILSPFEQEIYVQLLEDGTPWDRALELAQQLEYTAT